MKVKLKKWYDNNYDATSIIIKTDSSICINGPSFSFSGPKSPVFNEEKKISNFYEIDLSNVITPRIVKKYGSYGSLFVNTDNILEYNTNTGEIRVRTTFADDSWIKIDMTSFYDIMEILAGGE